MCKANDYIKQLTEIYQSICKDYEEHDLKLIKLNAQQQDLLHMIENESLDEQKGYQLAKTIKDVRLDRRNTKNELETLKQLKKGFVDESIDILNKVAQEIKVKEELLIKLNENKTYKQRVVDDEIAFSTGALTKHREDNFKPNAKTLKGYPTQILEDNGSFYECIVKHGNGYQKQTIKKCNLILDK